MSACGRIVVVGIGADGMAGLPPASADELRRATVVYGSPRQLDLLDDSVSADRRRWPSPMLPALVDLFQEARSDVHVVASGDPMFHGIGTTLTKYYGVGRVTVLPHVSSVTLACARLGWAVQDAEVISLVTAQTPSAVRRGGRSIVLSRNESSAAELARLLTATGRGESVLTLLEQLGGPQESIRSGTALEWSVRPPDDVDPLNVIAVEYRPDERIITTLPDDVLAHDGQLTKQSMRAVTMAALAPRPGELLWDVGAGSGSIAIEWARGSNRCDAVAFERDGARRERITKNATAFGAAVEVRGPAPESFEGVRAPTAIFIGGGLTHPGLLEGCYFHLMGGGRLVANAVTIESEAVLAQWHSKHGGEMRRYQHYRGEPVGGFTGWRAAMPVTQWTMIKP
jgi:precorrin-6Y C5,15-methyltransferase (decarboxylating)